MIRKKLLLVFQISFICLSLMYTGCNTATKPIALENISKNNALSSVFKIGKHEASVMQIVTSKRMVEIMNKMKKSIKKNEEWYKDYINKYAAEEGAMPWDEKLGVTEAEYEEIIHAEKGMKMVEKEKIEIEFAKGENGNIIIKDNQSIPYLSGLRINVAKRVMSNEIGEYVYDSEINNTDENSVTGKWKGASWTHRFEDLLDLKNIDKKKTYGDVKISIGQLEISRQMIIYYKERVIKEGNAYKGEEIVYINE